MPRRTASKPRRMLEEDSPPKAEDRIVQQRWPERITRFGPAAGRT